MRRKVIALLLCGALAASVLAGCGSAKEEANAPAESSTAESGETVEQTEEDAETGEGREAEDQDTGAVNEYGLTDAQQEALSGVCEGICYHRVSGEVQYCPCRL